jgi:hypothetical protein
MRKFIVCIGLLSLMAVPATAQGERGEHPGAVRFCQAERVGLGVAAFRARYAKRNGRHAFARCIAAHGRVRAETLGDARPDCAAERRLIGAPAFRAKYGLGPRRRAASPRCIAAHRAAERAADKAARVACIAQRNQLGVAGFREEWGVGANDRRAAARCVDATAQDTDSPTAQS